jgi:hypothetical protein
MTTLIRKSIFRACKDAAEAQGLSFKQMTVDPQLGGRIVYVIDTIVFTPGDAAKHLGISLEQL